MEAATSNASTGTVLEDVKADVDIGQLEPDVNQLHRAVKRGCWVDANSHIRDDPDSIFSTTASMGRTVLHVAVAVGEEGIVKELVGMADQRLLRMQDRRGYTALALAAELTDNRVMAECMVKKGGVDLVTMKTEQEIPLLFASAKGHRNMTRYLYSVTPTCYLFGENEGRYAVMLLTRCISAGIYDVAAALIQNSESTEMPLYLSEPECQGPMHALAHMPSAFRSGIHLRWWQQFIYNCSKVETHLDLYSIKITVDVELNDDEADTDSLGQVWVPKKLLCQHFGHFLQPVFQTSIIQKLTGSDEIYEAKKDHHLVLEILKWLSKRVSKLDEQELQKCSAYESMIQAAKYGLVEFIDSMRRANPGLLWVMDKDKRGIFSHAILNRHEKVFKLIHEIGSPKEIITSRKDVSGNNLLHLAAEEAGPFSFLTKIPNSALQMQRELQWFNDVKSIVPAMYMEAKNKDGKKPYEVFTKTHQEMKKDGEKWAKATAKSFALVSTLIITITFAAAFTVPGGNNQTTGIPIFLETEELKRYFTYFILVDAVSLVMSKFSLLISIRVLTMRYSEQDFLWRLPLKLIFSLGALILSVELMIIAFALALYMMMQGHPLVLTALLELTYISLGLLMSTLFFLYSEIYLPTIRRLLLACGRKSCIDCYII